MSQRLNGTLTLHKSPEEHGHLRLDVAGDTISGHFSDKTGKSYPARVTIDDAVNLIISLMDGDAKIRFGENLKRSGQVRERDVYGALANGVGHGTYLGKEITATYEPTPTKTSPRPQPVVGTPLPVERPHGGGYRIG